MQAFIYCWTNTRNNMRYIGSHVGTECDGYVGSGKRFRHAINKHGLGTFEREILEYCTSEDVLLREQYYLDLYNAAASAEFYNISPSAGGGNCGNGAQISATKKARNIPAHNKGVSMSADQKEKLSDVWEIEKDDRTLIITNMMDFCQKNNLNPSAMSAVARGKRSHHKGYKCKKLHNNRKVDYQYREWKSKGHAAKANLGSANGNSKGVCINGTWYDSMREAADATGMSMYLLRKNGVFKNG